MSTVEVERNEINYLRVLCNLTTENTVGFGADEIDKLHGKLQKILNELYPLLYENDRKILLEKCGTKDIRYQYVYSIVYILKIIHAIYVRQTDAYISVNDVRTFKVAIELIVSIGILPCLLPGVGIDMKKLCPHACVLPKEKTTVFEKYERLSLSTDSLIEFYNSNLLRPTILTYIGVLLAALFQLSYAPLRKPSKVKSSVEKQGMENKQFIMTEELHQKLKEEQQVHLVQLSKLLDNCPSSIVIKELMVILGLKDSPKWLRNATKKYLVAKLLQSDGILSLVSAICEDALDLGVDWNKLDVIARLISSTHGVDSEKYFSAVCPQLLDLLTSKKVNHSLTIANHCISTLYVSNPESCIKYIIEPITSPLLLKCNKEEMRKIEVEQEQELDICITNLTNCFITSEVKFKTLPIKLISTVAVPLFCLYDKIRSSAFVSKNKVKQLLLKLLEEKALLENLFAAFLGHTMTEIFGKYIVFEFGSSGGLRVCKMQENLPYEDFADCLLNLIPSNSTLCTDLFCYLLKFFIDSMNTEHKNKQHTRQNLLETPYDQMELMEKQLSAVKLLSQLANMAIVQETQIQNPETLLSFIKLLFKQYSIRSAEEECEIVYIGLMLIKMMLAQRNKLIDHSRFAEFKTFLKEQRSNLELPPQLVSLIKEIISLFSSQEKSKQTHYTDLSANSKQLDKFEEALRDLSDPLLPVRAHGLITLTKLVENKDCSEARQAIILRLFQENLKHEDSFIYLVTVNGMSALAVNYPDVIEILVQEYIDMPQRISHGELAPETRVKLGEILVRTTRSLGETAVRYKNLLINGFLCATRDPDPMVRTSSLSCLGEFCKILGFCIGNALIEILYCVNCILESDKVPECRRATTLVITFIFRGMGKHALFDMGKELVVVYRTLKRLRDDDSDPILRLHAQLALEEIDDIVQDFLFRKPKLEKTIFLLK